MIYVQQGLELKAALRLTGLTKHAYYYRSKVKPRRRGRRPSTVTQRKQLDQQCFLVITAWSEADLVGFIKARMSDPDLCHGYRGMTDYLRNQGFEINYKKVYRIMKGEDLLQEPRRSTGKTRVSTRRFQVDAPLRGLEMDIKFVYVHEYRRRALILSIIDVFTRQILAWSIGYSIKASTVKMVWEQVIEHHLQAADLLAQGVHVQIRNDNDPRFSAATVQEFFEANYLGQVFTHPYTPQENGHIESFHYILSRSVANHSFATLKDLEEHMAKFYKSYNEERVHGSIAGLPPLTFAEQWHAGNIRVIKSTSGKQRFKLTVPRYTLAPRIELSGNMNQMPVVAI